MLTFRFSFPTKLQITFRLKFFFINLVRGYALFCFRFFLVTFKAEHRFKKQLFHFRDYVSLEKLYKLPCLISLYNKRAHVHRHVRLNLLSF